MSAVNRTITARPCHKVRRYPTEEAAKKALWVMGLNSRGYESKLRIERCPHCRGYHMRRT